jgi:hypothetical protein
MRTEDFIAPESAIRILELEHSYSRGFIASIRGTLEAILSIGPKIAKENPLEACHATDHAIFQSGGGEWLYIGNLDQYPREWWNRLDRLPNRKAAQDAANIATFDHITKLAKS